MTFSVSPDGEANQLSDSPDGEANQSPESLPEPNADDRQRARLLAEGGGFTSDAENMLAQGFAVARAGGDLRAFIHEQHAIDRLKTQGPA